MKIENASLKKTLHYLLFNLSHERIPKDLFKESPLSIFSSNIPYSNYESLVLQFEQNKVPFPSKEEFEQCLAIFDKIWDNARNKAQMEI